MIILLKYFIYTLFSIGLFFALFYSGPKLGYLVGNIMGVPKEKIALRFQKLKTLNIILDVIFVMLFSYFTMFK